MKATIISKRIGKYQYHYVGTSRYYINVGIKGELTTASRKKLRAICKEINEFAKDYPKKPVNEILEAYKKKRDITLMQAIKKLETERKWSKNTSFSYLSLYKHLGNCKLREIDPDDFLTKINHLDNNTKAMYVNRLNTLLSLIDSKITNPYKLRITQNTNSITLEELKYLKTTYLSMSPSDKKYKYLQLILLTYELQGLSLVDLLSLTKDNFTKSTINNVNYYIIKTHRRKTGKPVTITLEINDYTESLLKHPFKLTNNYNKLGYYCTALLQKLLGRHLTLYSIRRGVATILVNSGVPLYTVAQMLGRSVNGMECYLSAPVTTIIQSRINL